jgi:hypothetical protein
MSNVTRLAVIELHQVDLRKEQLDRIPELERRLFVLIAHAANELNALAKLFHFAASSASESGVIGQAENAQALVLARVLTGKIYEFWQLLQTSFFGAQLSREYQLLMDEDAREALDELKRYFGRDNLVSLVRNKFAFHYSTDQVDAGYKALVEGDPLQVYLAKRNVNSLYAFADTIAGRAMLEAIQPGDHEAAFHSLITETSKSVQDIGTVIDGLMIVCFRKYMGSSLYELSPKLIQVEGVPEGQQVGIPFFIEIPEASDEDA